MATATLELGNAVRAGFPVQQIVSDSVKADTRALSINLHGMELATTDESLAGARYFWLDFALPDEDSSRIRALGELVGRDEGRQTVRFKHLFPDHRRTLASYVRTQDTLHQAA